MSQVIWTNSRNIIIQENSDNDNTKFTIKFQDGNSLTVTASLGEILEKEAHPYTGRWVSDLLNGYSIANRTF